MASPPPSTILWLRRDLRLHDNPALAAALRAATSAGSALLPFYVWDDETATQARPGAAASWWLCHSLATLEGHLSQRGSRLLVRRGLATAVLLDTARRTCADTIVWAAGADPPQRAEDEAVTAALRAAGIEPRLIPGAARLVDRGDVRTRAGGPFKVFTPFWRACLERPVGAAPLAAPRALPPAPLHPATSDLGALRDTCVPRWAVGFTDVWEPGEAGASARLARLLSDILGEYEAARERPDLPGTSRLSPHLHWGEISPRQVRRAVDDHVERCEMGSCPSAPGAGLRAAAKAFLRQLFWREFAHHVLDAHSDLATAPLDQRFAALPWRDPVRDPVAAADLAAWQRGRTGYPLVDAGMRELWTTGWLHNRVRMVCGSFLVKHLLLPWQYGETWFWDTLVDADAANNAFGWQWIAGCGADAAPYFRIFSPMLQGDRYDQQGDYVRRWVPELAGLPQRWLNRPWEAPRHVLSEAGVKPGETYPSPIVDHAVARARALDAFATARTRPHQGS